MSFKTTNLGWLYEDENIICLFGNKNSNVESLKKEFPGLKFTRLKQVHGNEILNSALSEDFLNVADAHHSKNKGHALCINTADCIPVLIHSEKENLVLAIHAGWRGVANRILPKAILKLIELGACSESLKVFIGPHIGFESFEVDIDVKDQLLKSVKEVLDPRLENHHKVFQNDKYKINLLSLIQMQLREFAIMDSQLKMVLRDTFTDLEFHSFRRDKEKSGRQISFIAMKG